MRLLADESCTGPVLRALRSAGHDVVAISEEAKGAHDEDVIARAFREQRVLVTEDTDFGEHIAEVEAGVSPALRYSLGSRGQQSGRDARRHFKPLPAQ